MNTVPLSRHPLDTRFGTGTVLTTAIAVLAIALTIAFIAVPLSGNKHAVAKHPGVRSQPVTHFYGIGAPAARNPLAPRVHQASSQHFYGLQP